MTTMLEGDDLRGALRAAMRTAMHARWCGPVAAACDDDCEGWPDDEELDAAVDAAVTVVRDAGEVRR